MTNYDYTHKPCLIILEGVDRTGKTTVQSHLDQVSNYRNFVLIRGPIGFLTYNKIYDKKVKEKYYLELEEQLLKVRHFVIFLYAPLEVLEKRAKETNQKKPLPKGGTWEEHLKTYNFYYEKSKLNKIKFDTSKWTALEIAEQVLGILEDCYL